MSTPAPPKYRATYRPPKTPPSQKSVVLTRKPRPYQPKPVPYFDESVEVRTAALKLQIPPSTSLTFESEVLVEMAHLERLSRQDGSEPSCPREAVLLRNAPPAPAPRPPTQGDILRSDIAAMVVEHKYKLMRAQQHMLELQKRVDSALTSACDMRTGVFSGASRPLSPRPVEHHDNGNGFSNGELSLDLSYLEEDDINVGNKGRVSPCNIRMDSPVPWMMYKDVSPPQTPPTPPPRMVSTTPPVTPPGRELPKGFSREELALDLSFLEEDDGVDTAVRESRNALLESPVYPPTPPPTAVSLPPTPTPTPDHGSARLPAAPMTSPQEASTPQTLLTSPRRPRAPPPSPPDMSSLPTPPWKHISRCDVTLDPGSPAKCTPPKLPSALLTPQMRSAIVSGKKMVMPHAPEKLTPKKALPGPTKATPITTITATDKCQQKATRLVKKTDEEAVTKLCSKLPRPVKPFKPHAHLKEGIKPSRVTELLKARRPEMACKIPVLIPVLAKPSKKLAEKQSTAQRELSLMRSAPPPTLTALQKAVSSGAKVPQENRESRISLPQKVCKKPSYAKSASSHKLPPVNGAMRAAQMKLQVEKAVKRATSEPWAYDPYKAPLVPGRLGGKGLNKMAVPKPPTQPKPDKPIVAKHRKFKVSKGI